MKIRRKTVAVWEKSSPETDALGLAKTFYRDMVCADLAVAYAEGLDQAGIQHVRPGEPRHTTGRCPGCTMDCACGCEEVKGK